MSADRFNFNKSWEHIQNKYVNTGHSDMSKFEWGVNQQRDALASYIGHYDHISFYAVAKNEAVGRMRYEFLEVSQNSFVCVDTFSRFCFHRKCCSLVVLLRLKMMMMLKVYFCPMTSVHNSLNIVRSTVELRLPLRRKIRTKCK